MTQLNLPPLPPEIPSDSSEEENYVELILERVEELLEKDPELQLAENTLLRQELIRRDKNKTIWARIS